MAHKLLITDPKGVVINTKHYALGSIIDNVPLGIAKACVHFKQAKDIGAASIKSDEDEKGTALEVFTRRVKTVLVDDHDLDEEDAEDLILDHKHLVGLGALGGLPAVEQTAFALVQTLGGPLTGNGTIATPMPGAGADLGTDQPTPLQQANADAENAEVTSGASSQTVDLESMELPALRDYAAGKGVSVAANATRRTVIAALNK